MVASYDLRLGNGVDLFSKEKIAKEKSEEKRISGGSIQCKQVNNIHSAEMNKRIKGALFPEPAVALQPDETSGQIKCLKDSKLYWLVGLLQHTPSLTPVG